MAVNILFHIFIPIIFFISFQFKYAGINFIVVYAFMLYFLGVKRDNKRTFISAFIIFFIFWLMVLNWLLVINVDLTPLQRVLVGFGWVLLSAIMGVTWSLPFSFLSLKNNEIFLLPAALSAIEYMLSSMRDLSFLWITPSTALMDYPVLIQSADIGGSYLLSFIVIMFAVLICKILMEKRNIIYKLVFLLFLFLITIYGVISLNKPIEGEKIAVTLVQPNMPGEMKESYREFIDFRFKLIKKNLEIAKKQNGEIIIFPETASPVYLTKKTKNDIKTFLVDYTNENSKAILIGGLTYEYGEKNEEDNYYNSAFLISPNETIQSYNKIRCVPFVERLPYEEKLKFIKKIDYGQGGYSVGKNYTVFNYNNKKFSAYICFESIFPTHVSAFVKNGAQFLVNISEDAWFIKGIGAYQHYQSGILRAVENRRYLIRVSNPGISAVIDPYGTIIFSTKLNTDGVFTKEIVMNDKLSIFTRSGNLIPKIFLWITLLILIFKIIWRKYGTAKIKNRS